MGVVRLARGGAGGCRWLLGWPAPQDVNQVQQPIAGVTFTGGNHVGNRQNVGDHGDNHDDYHTEEVKHSNNEHPKFPAATSRLDHTVNRR